MLLPVVPAVEPVFTKVNVVLSIVMVSPAAKLVGSESLGAVPESVVAAEIGAFAGTGARHEERHLVLLRARRAAGAQQRRHGHNNNGDVSVHVILPSVRHQPSGSTPRNDVVDPEFGDQAAVTYPPTEFLAQPPPQDRFAISRSFEDFERIIAKINRRFRTQCPIRSHCARLRGIRAKLFRIQQGRARGLIALSYILSIRPGISRR